MAEPFMVKFSFPDYLFFLICLQRLDIYIKKLKQVYLYPFSGNSILQKENQIFCFIPTFCLNNAGF